MLQSKQINKLVNYLSRLEPDEIDFVRRTIQKANSRHLPVAEAAKYTSLAQGQRISFVDRNKETHEGVIAKVNYKHIRVLDEAKRTAYVRPEMIKKVFQ